MKDYVIIKKSIFKALVDEIKKKAGIPGKIKFKNVTNTLANVDVVEDENPVHISVFSTNSQYGEVTPSFSGKVGEVVTITATAKNDGVFEGWTDGVTTASREITLSQSESYSAIFNKYYTASISVNATQRSYGRVIGSGSYHAGSTATIVALPNIEYLFSRWSDGSISNPRTINMDSNKAIKAFFTRQPVYYAIIAFSNDDTMGSVSGGGTYLNGLTVTLTATPKDGYKFDGWSDGVTESTRTITVSYHAAYVANFSKIEQSYNVNLSIHYQHRGRGEIYGGGTFKEGTTITIMAFPYGGYLFSNWSDGNNDNPRTITVNSNMTLKAYFGQPPAYYHIGAVSSNNNMGSVSGGGTYMDGQTITIAATPKTGYKFDSWSDGVTNASRTINVIGNDTYVANFSEISNDD